MHKITLSMQEIQQETYSTDPKVASTLLACKVLDAVQSGSSSQQIAAIILDANATREGVHSFSRTFAEQLSSQLRAYSTTHQLKEKLITILTELAALTEETANALLLPYKDRRFYTATDAENPALQNVRLLVIHPILKALSDLEALPIVELKEFTDAILTGGKTLVDIANTGDAVRARVTALMERFSIFETHYDTKLQESTWQQALCPVARFTIAGFPVEIPCWGLIQAQEILAINTIMSSLQELSQSLPDSAAEALLVQQYGAKGAHLLMAEKVLKQLQEILYNDTVELQIPAFTLIPTEVFDRWRAGESIETDLRNAYAWAEGRALKIRSSAVAAEDGNLFTGAGRYESFDCPKDASFEEFQAFVLQVYSSVEMEKAETYRREKNIPTERMAVIIQELAFISSSHKGFINTIRAGRPELMEIVHGENGCRPILNRNTVSEELCNRYSHIASDMLLYQMEDPELESTECVNLSVLGMALELVFNRPLQIEYATDYSDMATEVIKLFQWRQLPKAYCQQTEVSFPSEEPLFEGVGLSACDLLLDVLPASTENREKTGVVIFKRSFAGSLGFRPEKYFPKEGAIVVLTPSRDSSGHIETLAIEKGLVCIFSPGKGDSSGIMAFLAHTVEKQDGMRVPIEDNLYGHRRVRIVADGLTGKIYPASEEPRV